MFGHGLKHLFHSRRRSREREHPSSQDPQQQQQGMSDHESPDEKERSPEMHRVSYAMSLHDLPARPTAFNRVLQQIRAREQRAFFSCLAWRAIKSPLSKVKRRLDSLEATQGAPRDPRRDSRGERSPWLPETRPDSPGEPGMQPRDPCLPWRGISRISSGDRPHPEVRREGREPLADKAGESTHRSRSEGEKGLR